jgi:hypothetical protein
MNSSCIRCHHDDDHVLALPYILSIDSLVYLHFCFHEGRFAQPDLFQSSRPQTILI